MIRSQGRRLMTMRIRVMRLSSTRRDEYGGPAAGQKPDVIFDGLPCRAWAPTDPREVFDDAQAVAGAIRLSVPLDAELEQGDTIEDVRDRIGRVVFPGPLKVTSVIRLGTDLAVMARIQAGGS